MPTTKTPSKARAAKPSPKAPTRRPKIAKADGDEPVRKYIASLDGWKREVAQRFDDVIAREVPRVRRAVKWSAPMYGIEGQGWFASFGAFKEHVKLVFFRGTDLKPVPPSGNSQQMRSLDLKETDRFDEALVAKWVRQASKIPGWGGG